MRAIEVTQLTKTFRRGARALDRISLTVERGEMVALIGASGSGKSTLLRHIAGLVSGDRDGGRIAVLGEGVQNGGRIASDVRRVRSRIGFVFQQFNLVGRLSVMTNVLLGLLGSIPGWRGSLGLFTREEKLIAQRALRRVGIDSMARQRASTLSGGQQQRAAIARTLVQRAEIVLADEPIASLDPASAERVMQALAEINREDGITVVVSLHQVDYAMRHCRRVVALRDGRIVYDGSPAALTVDMLHELYGAEGEDLLLGRAAAPEKRIPERRPALATAAAVGA